MEDTIKKKEKYLKGAWKKAQENYDSTGKEQKIKDAKEQIDKVMNLDNYLVLMCSLDKEGSEKEASVWSSVKDISPEEIENILYTISQSFKVTKD